MGSIVDLRRIGVLLVQLLCLVYELGLVILRLIYYNFIILLLVISNVLRVPRSEFERIGTYGVHLLRLHDLLSCRLDK